MDVKILEVTVIHPEGIVLREEGDGTDALYSPLLQGAHGKGLYSGQGVLVYSNNGEANQEAYRNFDFEPTGSLNEWNGKDWKLIRRNQFVASHNFRIHDYASYRGLLVMTGIHPDAEAGEHIIR